VNERQKQLRQFWVILSIVFIGFLGISMPYLIFPALFLNPEFTILPTDSSDTARALLLGVTLAAYPLGQFIGSPILGSLSDDYGRKGILSLSLIISGLFNLLTGFAIHWHMLSLLIISRFITGIMEGNIAIARAMATDLSTISKHNAFGKINAIMSIAYLVGPLLGGLMTDRGIFEGFTTSTPFYFICILFFALALLTNWVIEDKPTNTAPSSKTFIERLNLYKRLKVLFKNRRLKFLLLISTCFTLAVDIFYEFGPVYLTIKWEFDPSDLVFYNGLLCLALAVGNGLLPSYFSTRVSNSLAITCAIGMFSLFLIGVTWTDSQILMLLFFGLCGLAIGLAVTLLTVKISNSVSENIQGEVLGTQLSLRVLGDAIICLFGGLTLLLSPKFILVFAALMSIAAMTVYGVRTFVPSMKHSK
jgi:MFS family permease